MKDVIITPMLKKVDVGVYEFLKSVKAGTFTSGEKVFTLNSNGAVYSTTGVQVDDIKAKLDDLKQQIVDGKITVPTKP